MIGCVQSGKSTIYTATWRLFVRFMLGFSLFPAADAKKLQNHRCTAAFARKTKTISCCHKQLLLGVGEKVIRKKQ